MILRLYHTGERAIPEPDIHFGRKNADFGQGFYLTPDREFTLRWAGENAVVNEYELDLAGLAVLRLERDEAWFDYIFQNRRLRDGSDADVVMGPIANDTLFDTLGIVSSGFLSTEEALRLLRIGPEYTQVAVKTPRAAEQLRWLGAETVSGLDSALRSAEQAEYQRLFGRVMAELAGED